MKSDVIRKRSRHDARRAGSGDIPSASPGASRRASPSAQTQTSPLLTADLNNQADYSFPDEYDLNSGSTPQQSDMIGPLNSDSNSNTGVFSSQATYDGNLTYSSFPGPYHPEYLLQHHPDSLSFVSGEISEDASDGFGIANVNRSNKRRRMSNDSASEPPSSSTSYSSYDQSSNQYQQSIRSALDYPFTGYMNYNNGNGRDSSDNAFWHPPMAPRDKSPQTLIHPPMLPPPEESPMDFLHPPMLPQDDADQLFASYVHRPMVLSDSPMPQVGTLYPHPPMVLSDNMYTNFSRAHGQGEFYEHNNNFNSTN